MTRADPAAATGNVDGVTLRRWTSDDRWAMREMNADPQVMTTIGPVMDDAASDAFIDRIDRSFVDHGFGLWCVDVNGEPAGFCGLMLPWFRDGVEIGWRLRSSMWGRGIATTAARLAVDQAFSVSGLGLTELISFTAAINSRSIAVMERLGMERDLGGDFLHPGVPPESPLAPHVLYRLSAARYRDGL